MLRPILVCFFLLLCTATASAKEIKPTNEIEALIAPLAAVPFGGERKPTLDVQVQGSITNIRVSGPGSWAALNNVLFTLLEMPAEKSDLIISTLRRHYNDIPAPLLYDLARRLYLQDKVEEATTWLFMAQFRSRYDARRCTERQVGPQVQAIMTALRPYFAGITNMHPLPPGLKERVFERLLNDKNLFDSAASPWWICSTSLIAYQFAESGATMPENAWLLPRTEWDPIQKDLIAGWSAGLKPEK